MNPISRAKTLEAVTTTYLAKRLGLSKQYISRVEQGAYEKPNDKLLVWTTNVLNKSLDTVITAKDVEALYRKWQWEKRHQTKDRLSLRPCSITEYDVIRQPEIIYYHKIFRMWREGYWGSSHGFSVDMCLQSSLVNDYEEGNTQKMPGNLKKVMLGLGLLGEGFKTNER